MPMTIGRVISAGGSFAGGIIGRTRRMRHEKHLVFRANLHLSERCQRRLQDSPFRCNLHYLVTRYVDNFIDCCNYGAVLSCLPSAQPILGVPRKCRAPGCGSRCACRVRTPRLRQAPAGRAQRRCCMTRVPKVALHLPPGIAVFTQTMRAQRLEMCHQPLFSRMQKAT